MKVKKILLIAAATALLTACSSGPKSPLPYFEDVQITEGQVVTENPTFTPTIVPDDELYISVMSLNMGATAAYNLPIGNPSRNAALGQTTQPQQQTYLVDAQGDIEMPILGKVHVAGLTTDQLQAKLTKLISADVEDPTVTVRLINFKVNVAGEVKVPGPQQVGTERYSILDALTAAGDMTEWGERDNVLLIREENGQRVAHRLNLNSVDLLNSPYFYLRQNDYVYVTPNRIRQENSKYNTNNAFKVTVVSTIVSGVSVITSLVIALAIK